MRAGGYRLVAACLLSLTGALCLGAGIASAQTTTVPPIPVTPAPTTTVATSATSGTASTGATGSLASTGMAADLLVPFGFGLIGVGGLLQLAARRPRRDLGLL